MNKVPVAGTAISLSALSSGLNYLFKKGAKREFITALVDFTGLRYIYILDSGIAAFFVILKTLKEKWLWNCSL